MEDEYLEAAYEDRYDDLYPVGSEGYWLGADEIDMESVDDDRDMWDDVPDDEDDPEDGYGFDNGDYDDEPPF